MPPPGSPPPPPDFGPFTGLATGISDVLNDPVGFATGLFGNPFVGGGLGFLLGGPQLAIPGFLASTFLGQVNESNIRGRGLQADVSEPLIGGGGIAEQQLDVLANIPTVGINGVQIAGPPVKPPEQAPRGTGIQRPPVFDFELGGLLSAPAQATLEFFQENRPGPEAGLIMAEDLLAGIDLPETDLSDVLAARLGGISEASTQRQLQQRQELASLAGQVGGLENLRRQQQSLAFGEGQQRAKQATAVTAQTRAEELAAQQFVSDLQERAATQAALLTQANQQRLFNEFLAEAEAFKEAQFAPAQEILGAIDTAFQQAGLESNLLGAAAQTILGTGAFLQPFAQENIVDPLEEFLALAPEVSSVTLPQQFVGTQ